MEKKEIEKITPNESSQGEPKAELIDDKKEEMKNNLKQNKKTLIIAILLLAAFITSCILLTPNNKSTKKEETEEKEPPNTTQSKTLIMYQCKGYISDKKSEFCENVAFEVPVSTDNPEVYTYEQSNFVLYNDNGLKLYNDLTKEITEINLDDTYQRYNLNYNNDHTEVVGIIFYNDSTDYRGKDYGYYNITSNKVLYKDQYNRLNSLNEKYIQAFIAPRNEDDYKEAKVVLLSATEEKEYYAENEGTCKRFEEKVVKDNRLLYMKDGCTGGSVDTFYDDHFQIFAHDIFPNEYDFDKSGNVIIKNDNKAITYNNKGEYIKEYPLEGDVQHIFYDYYLTIINQKLYVKDYYNFQKDLMEWNDKYHYHYMISGYYDANALSNESEKNAGYYFNISYDQSESPGVEFYLNPKTKEIKSWELEEVGSYAKPVLYLYPEKETKVEINFQHEDRITISYPKFEEKWEVIAKPNGDLYDKSGKYYYGLYWEEEKSHQISFNEGFYVTKENAITFLEEKLSTIGLNNHERNEFIMYWLPILEKNNQSLVYFELTEERNNYNEIYITPAPDSLLRIAIHVKPVSKEINIKEQKLTTFKRTGFTAVEWGGILYK